MHHLLHDNGDGTGRAAVPVGGGTVGPERGPARLHRLQQCLVARDVQDGVVLSGKRLTGGVLLAGGGPNGDPRAPQVLKGGEYGLGNGLGDLPGEDEFADRQAVGTAGLAARISAPRPVSRRKRSNRPVLRQKAGGTGRPASIISPTCWPFMGAWGL